MIEALINVLAVLGIIVVGGFVVVFLGNVLLTVLDSDNSKKNREPQQPQQPTYIQPAQPEMQQLQEPVKYLEEQNQAVASEYSDVDFEKALEEERMLNGYTEQPKVDETEEAFARLRAEEEAFRQERLRFIEERRLIEEEERLKKEQEAAAQ